MTVTDAPQAGALASAEERMDLVLGLAEAARFFRDRPRARLPKSPVCNVRVHGANRDEKIADLYAIAGSWGVIVQALPDGTETAQVAFGPVTFEAHVAPDYPTTTAYLDAHRARKAPHAAAPESGGAA